MLDNCSALAYIVCDAGHSHLVLARAGGWLVLGVSGRREMSGARRRLTGVGSVLTVLLLWHLSTATWGLVSPLSLPSPLSVGERLVTLTHEAYLGNTVWGHAWASIQVMFGGWAVAGLVGVPMGVAMSWSTTAHRLMLPAFQFLRSISPIAWIPLAIVWLGIDDDARMFVVFVAAVVPWTVSAMEAVRSVDPLLVKAARTLGAGRQTLPRVVLPAGMPTLLAGARIALGNAWTALIAAELLAATAGLGFLTLNSARVLDTPTMLASITVIGLLGMIFSQVLLRVTSRLAPWSAAA